MKKKVIREVKRQRLSERQKYWAPISNRKNKPEEKYNRRPAIQRISNSCQLLLTARASWEIIHAEPSLIKSNQCVQIGDPTPARRYISLGETCQKVYVQKRISPSEND